MKKSFKKGYPVTDEEAWSICPPEYRWLFNKMEVGLASGIKCGPREIAVPKTGKYIIRPVYNLYGMGLGVSERFAMAEAVLEDIPLGHFWSQKSEGQHLSFDVDLSTMDILLCVEGEPGQTTGMFSSWRHLPTYAKQPIKAFIPYIEIFKLEKLQEIFPVINIEAIGKKIIEIHLRPNPDYEGYEKPDHGKGSIGTVPDLLVPIYRNLDGEESFEFENVTFKKDHVKFDNNERVGFLEIINMPF